VIKYSRGGYHLIPIYLFLIAAGMGIAMAVLRSWYPALWRYDAAIIAVFGLVLTIPCWQVLTAYKNAQFAAINSAVSIVKTRLEPRDWLAKHMPPGSRVAIIWHTAWALPPIFDMGYDLSPDFLNFPYLDIEQMKNFLPPDFARVEQTADVVVFSNFHLPSFIALMREKGGSQTAESWERFYQEIMQRYPTVEFSSTYSNYGVNKVQIIAINGDIINRQ
jgi:hypothetical protein